MKETTVALGTFIATFLLVVLLARSVDRDRVAAGYMVVDKQLYKVIPVDRP